MHLHPHIARELSSDIAGRRRAEAARASIGVDRVRQMASTPESPAQSVVEPRRPGMAAWIARLAGGPQRRRA